VGRLQAVGLEVELLYGDVERRDGTGQVPGHGGGEAAPALGPGGATSLEHGPKPADELKDLTGECIYRLSSVVHDAWPRMGAFFL
jgi:hypothetical protein